MKNIIRLLSLIAFIISVIWFWAVPDFEPALAILGAMIGLITSCFIKSENEKGISQEQKITNNSQGIQAGGDVNITTKTKSID